MTPETEHVDYVRFFDNPLQHYLVFLVLSTIKDIVDILIINKLHPSFVH